MCLTFYENLNYIILLRCFKDASSPAGGKWWQKEVEETEYELDIAIPLALVEGEENEVEVEDTGDVYKLVSKPPVR